MLVALIIVGVIVGVCAWVAIRAIRVPKKAEHEQAPDKLHDPIVTAFKSGSGL